MDHDVIDRGFGDCVIVTPGHTGFVSIVTINAVESLVFALSNGAISQFGVLDREPEPPLTN